ncbi:MAG: AAA family ATPase [Acinetobacter sp.]|nr:AAA family ATPase [Acinetobacter sp.]
MIENIKIQNFKSIKDASIDLGSINVLIGANGVGKSNFISFFRLLKSLSNDKLNDYVENQGKMDNLIYFGEKVDSDIRGEITFSEFQNKPYIRYAFDLSADNRNLAVIKKETTSQLMNINDQVNSWRDSPSTNNTEHSLHLLASQQEMKYVIVRTYFRDFTVYHFHDTSFDAPLKKPARIYDHISLHHDGCNLPAFLYYLQERHPQRLYLIEKVIQSIAPFFGKFILKPDRINPESIQLEWLEKGYERHQNAHNLSDGTLRFIALTTLMLQPEPPKVIIIDEPELGLHPSAIIKLAGLVRKAAAKSQVIISTQSVNLMNEFEPEDIIVVDHKNKQSVFKRLDVDKLQIWLEDYGLAEVWDKGLIGGKP